MNIKNAKYTSFNGTTVECEIEHDEFGWIPFSAIEDDPTAKFVFDAIDNGLHVDPYEIDLTKLKEQKLMALKETRSKYELLPINGISVEKESHRTDLKTYAELLAVFMASSDEEKAIYSGLISSDGQINWTLADDTSRLVSSQELIDTYREYYIRKGGLMRSYQIAVEKLMSDETNTEENINDIEMDLSNV